MRKLSIGVVRGKVFGSKLVRCRTIYTMRTKPDPREKFGRASVHHVGDEALIDRLDGLSVIYAGENSRDVDIHQLIDWAPDPTLLIILGKTPTGDLLQRIAELRIDDRIVAVIGPKAHGCEYLRDRAAMRVDVIWPDEGAAVIETWRVR